jgi:hypothetical protein
MGVRRSARIVPCTAAADGFSISPRKAFPTGSANVCHVQKGYDFMRIHRVRDIKEQQQRAGMTVDYPPEGSQTSGRFLLRYLKTSGK